MEQKDWQPCLLAFQQQDYDKTIQLAERKMNEDTNEWEIVTHWDRIFVSLKDKEVENA